MSKLHLLNANALQIPLADNSVNMCVTSPPYYGLRDYGIDNQIGLEQTPGEYVQKMVQVFREVWRVMKDDGTLWLNLGDSYAGSGGAGNQFGQLEKNWFNKYKQNSIPDNLKPKDLIGIPWRVAFALQADGWYLRSDIIWHKPNPMPESVKDRPTKSHEYLFLLSKSERYYYDADAIMENYQSEPEKPRDKSNEGYNDSFMGGRWSEGTRDYYANGGRNKRSVWTVTTKPYKGAHFATFPQDLIVDCIKAGSKPGGLVLDPFNGSGTTGEVCARYDRNYIGIELNMNYIELSNDRLFQYKAQPVLFEVN